MSEQPDPKESGPEKDITHARPLVWALVAIILGAAIIALALLIAYRLIQEPEAKSPEQEPPMEQEAAGNEQAALQRAPQEDLAEYESRMEQRLHSVGWVDREQGIVHMPIDRAMDLLVQRGLGEENPAAEGESP